MNPSRQSVAQLSVTVAAAVLLLARRIADVYDLPSASAAAILVATGTGKSRAYELSSAILDTLGELERPVGRPRSTPESVLPADTSAISQKALAFVMAHPGCVSGTRRRRYADVYRHFVLELRDDFAGVDQQTFANAVGVPLGTLQDWLRDPGAGGSGGDNANAAAATAATNPRIQTILVEWQTWQGDFVSFCRHLKQHCRIPYGQAFISSVLALHGARIPKRRKGRASDLATRKSFVTFFPGAQWVGDGMQARISINREPYTFNVELDVDAFSGAFVGADVSDEEDAGAVVAAFRDGVQTTGAPPLSLLLDNLVGNHTDEVTGELGDDTIKIRSTLGRGQSKAHVEGGFGLFQQCAPELEIEACSPRELVAQFLKLCVQIWGRTLNHRPRKDRGGRSRVDIYADPNEKPNAEQVQAARVALEARRKKQEKAFETRRARQDPVARAILDRAFVLLDLDDPHGNVRRYLAGFPIDTILAGLAVFEAKRNALTLPPLDRVQAARYLGGIIRNVSERAEQRAFTEALIRLRLEARDEVLAHLESLHRDLLRDLHTPRDRIKAFVKHALGSERKLDQSFWLQAVADALATQPDSDQIQLVRFASLRIRSTYDANRDDRQYAIQFVAQSCPALAL